MALTLTNTLSHAELVALGARWLARKCSVVITELVTIGETPDVIGWQGTHSTLIECKVSASDFKADSRKPFRREEWKGIGSHRYYLTPPGLLAPDILPPRWGLLEATDCGLCVTRRSEHFDDVNSRHEIGILLSCLRRIGHSAPTGVSIKCYTIESKNTASIGILPHETPDGSLIL